MTATRVLSLEQLEEIAGTVVIRRRMALSMIRCFVSSKMNPQQEVPDRKTILTHNNLKAFL